MSYRLGIIGAGRIAQEHIRAARHAGAEVVCICDCDAVKANAFAGKYQCENAVSSISELLAMKDVDVVVVAVPNVFHHDVAVQCLRAGKDILLEKPMAMNVAECEAIIEAMNETGRLIQMGFVCRAAPKVEHVKQMIDTGELGNIYHVKASMYRQRGIPGLGRWFTTKALSGGGVLIDIGVHLIDLAMHLTGAKRAIAVSGSCESRFGHPISEYVYEEMWAGPPDPGGVFDVEDFASGLIRLDNEVAMELNVAWAVNLPQKTMPEGLLVLGDKAGCFFDLWGDRLTLTTEAGGKVVDQQVKFDNTDAWNRAWNRQQEVFAGAVAEKCEPLSNAASGRAVQEIVEAMYRSSEAQREVVIDGAP